MRCLLTRSIGNDPMSRSIYYTSRVNQGDFLVQCSDGLHQYVTEEEIAEIVTHAPPDEACRQLVALAEKRGTDDNLSVQVVRIDRVEEVMFYRGLPIYREVELPMSNEVEVGQVLDGRFQHHRGGQPQRHGLDLQGRRPASGQTVAVKIPFMQFESDPAFFTRFQREEAIGRRSTIPTCCGSCRSRRRAGRTSSWSSSRADPAAGPAERGAACRWPTPWRSPAASARRWSTCTRRTSSIAT